jgi:hypothetical protein
MRCEVAAMTRWPHGSGRKQASTQATVTTMQGKHVLTGTPTRTQPHSYHSHPTSYSAYDPISTRVSGCLAAPSPLFLQIITMCILTSLDEA